MDQLNAHPTSHARGKVRIADRINPVFNPEIIDGYRQRLHDGMLEYRVEVRQGVTLVSGYFLPFNSATNEVYVGSMREDIYDSKYFADLMLHNMQKVRHLPPDQGGQVSMARQAAMNMAIQQQSR
ncbi:MAG: hypothetical protein MRY49_02510 [Candidatus Pacebacteria bacterium]|nr:hypothetical protein [Candidatus Paceibacterota bacterium]